jgi:DNA (cytosine-5)-methyltransferase 1
VRIGSLFSGAGGLDMAVGHVFGATTAWHCEIDAAASKVLAHRYPGVPNHRDITTLRDVEPVDVIAGGWPCQPFSLAGKRKGAADERALWPEVARTVRMVRPRFVVLENVSAVLGPEFQRVANSLASLGYSLAWTCARASDVGAPHRRERLFAIAYTDEPGPQGPQPTPRPDLPIRRADADTECYGRYQGRAESTREFGGSDAALSGSADVTLLPTPQARDGYGAKTPEQVAKFGNPSNLNDYVVNEASRWGKYAPAIRRWENVTRPAPPPTEPNKNGNPRLSAAFSEWLMGWPEGWVTQVPGISRNDALRIVGNGVCPQQAHAALIYLLSVSELAA